MSADLEEDWASIRVATSRPAGAPLEGVEEEWATIRGIPEWIYTTHEGYGIHDMALWRLLPLGHRKGYRNRKNGTGSGRLEEFWTYKHDSILWAGSSYKPHPSQTSGMTYSMNVRQVSLTLEEAFKRLDTYRVRHLQRLRDGIAQYEKDIQERRNGIAVCKDRISEATALVFDESLLKRETP